MTPAVHLNPESPMRYLPLLMLVAACATMPTPEDWRAGRERAVAEHPEAFRPEYRDEVIAGRVVVGMNANEAMVAWGPPSTTNRTTAANGVTEQWVYRWTRQPLRYLYLENGIVTAVQD